MQKRPAEKTQKNTEAAALGNFTSLYLDYPVSPGVESGDQGFFSAD